jgi:hypothetical protein
MVILGHVKTMCLVVLGVALLLGLSGCSISDSVGSISDSSGSIAKSSESISASSTGDSKTSSDKKADKSYENDVQDFTVTYVRTSAVKPNQNGFMEGISDVASQNGIVDWEANPRTYRSIGKGLRKANVFGPQYEAYKRRFASGDSGKMDDIQEGYESKD